MSAIDGQMDILAALAEQEAQERFDGGALSGFTTSDEFDPWELHDAFEAWKKVHGVMGSSQKSHMWHIWGLGAAWLGAHASPRLLAGVGGSSSMVHGAWAKAPAC